LNKRNQKAAAIFAPKRARCNSISERYADYRTRQRLQDQSQFEQGNRVANDEANCILSLRAVGISGALWQIAFWSSLLYAVRNLDQRKKPQST
jgi:hypothetical protein